MNSLLLSMPGTPIIYYGDEIGMGDNIYLGDRNGVRTPMQWSIDRNAGFSRADPQRLYLPSSWIRSTATRPSTRGGSCAPLPGCSSGGDGGGASAAAGRPAPGALWGPRRGIPGARGGAELLGGQDPAASPTCRGVQAVELELTRIRGLAPVELMG